MSAPTLLPRPAATHEVLRAAALAVERGDRVVLASVIARRGSTPSTPGQKLVLLDATTALGTIGGGAIERVALAAMIEALRDRTSGLRIETFRLGPSLGMCCGGSVDVLIEPLGGAMDVVVVGAGHVGSALAPLLATLGFHVTVCDTREEAAVPERFGGAGGLHLWGSASAASPGAGAALRVLHADHDEPAVLEGVAPERGAFIVMTHDHQLDQAAIEHGLGRGFALVGGVGSRAKAARTRDRLEAKGFAEADIARVRMPIGADIGARSPAEIAVAIAAELIAFRAGVRRGPFATAAAHTDEPAAAPTDEPAAVHTDEPPAADHAVADHAVADAAEHA